MRGQWEGGGRRGKRENWGRERGNYFTYLERDKREPCLIIHSLGISFYTHGN